MKKKTTFLKHALILGIGLCSTTMFAQTLLKRQAFNGNPVQNQEVLTKYKANLDPLVSAYAIETINDDAIYLLAKNQENTANFTLSAGGHSWNLNLTRVDLRSDDYRAVVIGENGIVTELPKSEAVTYRGYANGNTNNLVFATICEDFVTFNISDANTSYQVEPLSWKSAGAPNNEYLVYNEADFKNVLACGVVYPDEQIKIQRTEATSTNNGSVCASFNAVLYGIKSLTDAKGGATATVSYLNSIFNAVASNYKTNHDIELKLTGCVASTSAANDPAASGSYNGYLTNCQSWGASGKLSAYAHDLAGIIGSFGSSGIGGVGGVATASSVCNNTTKYMWSSDLTPAYTMSHEWGHMFAVGHDSYTNSNPAYDMNASCGPNSGQNSCQCMMCIVAPGANGDPLNGMNRVWSQRSKTMVANYVASLSCKKTCVPAGPQAPVANFSADKTTKCGGGTLLVQFTDLSSNTPTSWAWDFGDGGTSTLQNPSHTYAVGGPYTVKLTATNSVGNNTATKTSYITVSNGTGASPVNVGYVDGSTATFSTANAYRAEYFQTYAPVFLNSFTVYTGDTAGYREFLLTDTLLIGAGNTTIYYDTLIFLPANSTTKVTVNWYIPVSGHYALGIWTAGASLKTPSQKVVQNIRRTSGMTGYPFTVPGLISIYSNLFAMVNKTPPAEWYVGYNWEVQGAGCTTGILGIAKENQNLSIYPNPSAGLFNIQYQTSNVEKATVEVYNLVGEKIYTTTTTFGNNSKEIIDLTTKAKGIYVVRVICDGHQAIQQIVNE